MPPQQSADQPPTQRCGIDSVEIARIARLLDETPADDLLKLFSACELEEAGQGADPNGSGSEGH